MLKSEHFANKQVATQHGTITFNSQGESTDLTEEQEKFLAKLPEFTYEKSEDEQKKEEEAKAKKEEEAKAKKEEEAKAKKEEEAKAKPKATPRKATPKKATSKKK